MAEDTILLDPDTTTTDVCIEATERLNLTVFCITILAVTDQLRTADVHLER